MFGVRALPCFNSFSCCSLPALQIGGRSKFGAPLEPGFLFSRLLFGNVYRKTTRHEKSFIKWILPWTGNDDFSEGIDGETEESKSNRGFWRKSSAGASIASNKPHVVIANGEAMQRVPASLRELIRCCRTYDVPLYIINDP